MNDNAVATNPPAWLTDILRCPGCLSILSADLSCQSLACNLGRFSRAENGAPILIDFSNSAIDEQSVRRPFAPGDGAPSRIRRLLKPLMGLTNGSGGVTAMKKAGDLLVGKRSPRILIIGGGERWEGLDALLALAPTAEILNSDVYPSPFVHVITDAHQLCFVDQSFDLVILQAVIEHLIDPGAAVEQVWRVLKEDGLVLADTPFLQAVHMGAHDFTRYTPLGQRALFKRFEELDVGVSAGPMSVLRWSIEHALRSIFRSKYPAIAIRPLTIPLGWIDQFSPRNLYALDACSGSYFIGRKWNRIATPLEIIASYRGAHGRR